MRPGSSLLGPLAWTGLFAFGAATALVATACTEPPADGTEEDTRFGGSCSDDDPLTFVDWGGFCDDRIDDNCTFDVDPADGCDVFNTNTPHPCNTGDEPCPATLPGSAPPMWDCTGEPPESVIAFARSVEANPQVTSFCSYVYESEAVPGEHYVTIAVENGADVRGPDGMCNADFAARRHFYLSDLEGETAPSPCPEIAITHPAPIDEQPLSNGCRKAMRNLFQAQGTFDPDIQFFARSREEALEKLAILDTAEIACIGINNRTGQPYRPGEVWVVQATAPMILVENSP